MFTTPFFKQSTAMYGKFLFMAISSASLSVLGLIVVQKRKVQEIYKGTKQFQDAIANLRSHEGALKYLGEPIEDGYLKIVNAKSKNKITDYEVKVFVSGSKSKGILYIWVRNDVENPHDFELYRIELQLDNMKQRMLIRNDDLRVENKTVAP